MARCKGKTKAGDQCRNNAISGTNFCYLKMHVAPGQSFGKRFLNYLVNQYWLGALAVVGVVLAVISMWSYLQDKKHNANSGSLSPYVEEAGLYLSVGGSRFILAPSARGVFLVDQGQPILTIHGMGGKMRVSANIRNEKGDLIAELRDNEWTHQARPAIFDRNYTDHVLEIRDSHG